MWDYIIHNKEVIINSLDLLGFLFITPELIKLVNPPFSIFLIILLYLAIGLSVFSSSLLLTEFFPDIPGWIAIQPFLLLLFGLGYFLLFMLDHWRIIATWLGRYMFSLGVALFLLPRLLAFAVAVYG